LVTLSSCLDRIAEESSIYNAVLSADTKMFSKEGLLNKVKQLKASKAQLVVELESCEELWKEAQEELNCLEEELSAEGDNSLAAIVNDEDRDQGNDNVETKYSMEETTDVVVPEELSQLLSTCQEKVKSYALFLL
jgi:hypothetical protein